MKRVIYLFLLSTIGMVSHAVAETASELDLERGKKVYGTTCFVCHGNDGKGPIPGVPDLTSKDSRLQQEEELLVKHVLEGFQTPGSPLAMPPKGGNPSLSEAEIRDVVAFMRVQFSGKPREK